VNRYVELIKPFTTVIYHKNIENSMKKGLTKKEQRVLYGLVKYPTLNDRQLSEETRVKHSTITAIRRRMHEEALFKTVRIPAMNKLGYELTVIGYGSFNTSANERLRSQFTNDLKKENKGLHYFLTSPEFYFFISAARNYTSFRKWAEELEYKFSRTDLFGSPKTWAIFPYGASKQVSNFDYSRAVSLMYGVKEDMAVKFPSQKVETRRLTKKERAVLQGLVDYPELTDVALSEKIKASRQVISSMKKRFEDNGLLRTTRVIDLGKVGYSILSFAHMEFEPKTPLKAGEGMARSAMAVSPIFYALVGKSESIHCSAYRTYNDYFKARKDLGSLHSLKERTVGRPIVGLIALGDAQTPVNCDYSNLIGEALGSLPS